MDDHEVLQHLLNLEAEASALVDDAQTEADRRISEGEKQSRIQYDDRYAREVEALEASCARELAAVRENYARQLEAYRESLKSMSLDTEAFSSQAEKFLISREL